MSVTNRKRQCIGRIFGLWRRRQLQQMRNHLLYLEFACAAVAHNRKLRFGGGVFVYLQSTPCCG